MATPTRVGSRRTASDAELAGAPTRMPYVRRVVVMICLVTVVVVFGAVVRQSWRATSQAAEVVRLEAAGAAMMHPMTTLLTELVTAQSAAVRGSDVNQTSVRSALDSLQDADAQYGAALQTTQRLSDLSAQIEAAFQAGETGRAAYQRYSAVIDLAIDLIRAIGDSSHLVHDPDLDSYYLMDAAIVRLPDAMVYAGRAADLVALAAPGTELTGEDAVRAAVARFNVSSDAQLVSVGLLTSVDSTERSELGSNIVEQLDSFRTAADAFAPPTMLQELATAVQAGAMAENASRVFAAAQSLAHLLLSELQALLTVRAEVLAQQQRLTAIATVAGTVVVVVVAWLVVFPGRRRAVDGGPGDTGPTPGRGSTVGEEAAVGRFAVDRRGDPGRIGAAISGSGRDAESGPAASGFAGHGARSVHAR
ncbi:MAG: hypothetical protein IRY85_04310 [Micromonosporaceae bacterium]|nr:hypothetical protein [Micromonosporaceae bacterium]